MLDGVWSIDSYFIFNRFNRKNIHVIDGEPSKIYLLPSNILILIQINQ